MKILLLKSAKIIIPLLVLMIPLDLFLSYNLKKSNKFNGELEVWNDIRKGTLDCDICIYGSSRAWIQIDPNIIADSLNKRVYNFGMDGHNFWLQYHRHLEYIKHNKIPDQIIVSIDEFSLQKREDLYLMDQFLPFMLWDNDIRKFTNSYNGFQDVDYYFPLMRYFGRSKAIFYALKNSIKPDKVDYRNNGYRAMHKEWENDLDSAKAIMDQFHVTVDSASVKLFERFLTECKQMNIDVILVNTPEYIEGQQFIDNREEVINLINRIALIHNVLFIDYSKDTLCMQKKYFYNATHLNAQGSKIFTIKLLADLMSQNVLIANHADIP